MNLPYTLLDQQLPAPSPLYFRYEQLDANTGFERHCHPWGQINRISLGLMTLVLDDSKLMTPADYLVWVPAHVPHTAHVRQAMDYTSVYVCDALAARLPARPCLIAQSALVRALLEDFCQRRVTAMTDEWDVRQGELLIEHLVRAGSVDSYLPDSDDRQLQPILAAIRQQPGDNTTLAVWAQRVHCTERTLARRCQQALGMSFVQWRNRVRLLQALAWLKESWPIQDIAAQLGYGNPSAFIVMFHKQTGLSPERYRRQMRGEG